MELNPLLFNQLLKSSKNVESETESKVLTKEDVLKNLRAWAAQISNQAPADYKKLAQQILRSSEQEIFKLLKDLAGDQLVWEEDTASAKSAETTTLQKFVNTNTRNSLVLRDQIQVTQDPVQKFQELLKTDPNEISLPDLQKILPQILQANTSSPEQKKVFLSQLFQLWNQVKECVSKAQVAETKNIPLSSQNSEKLPPELQNKLESVLKFIRPFLAKEIVQQPILGVASKSESPLKSPDFNPLNALFGEEPEELGVELVQIKPLKIQPKDAQSAQAQLLPMATKASIPLVAAKNSLRSVPTNVGLDFKEPSVSSQFQLVGKEQAITSVSIQALSPEEKTAVLKLLLGGVENTERPNYTALDESYGAYSKPSPTKSIQSLLELKETASSVFQAVEEQKNPPEQVKSAENKSQQFISEGTRLEKNGSEKTPLPIEDSAILAKEPLALKIQIPHSKQTVLIPLEHEIAPSQVPYLLKNQKLPDPVLTKSLNMLSQWELPLSADDEGKNRGISDTKAPAVLPKILEIIQQFAQKKPEQLDDQMGEVLFAKALLEPESSPEKIIQKAQDFKDIVDFTKPLREILLRETAMDSVVITPNQPTPFEKILTKQWPQKKGVLTESEFKNLLTQDGFKAELESKSHAKESILLRQQLKELVSHISQDQVLREPKANEQNLYFMQNGQIQQAQVQWKEDAQGKAQGPHKTNLSYAIQTCAPHLGSLQIRYQAEGDNADIYLKEKLGIHQPYEDEKDFLRTQLAEIDVILRHLKLIHPPILKKQNPRPDLSQGVDLKA